MPGEIRGENGETPQGMAARFGSFELDPQRRQLSREGQVQHLTPKAFDLLWLLVEASPRVVPKSEIHQALWPAGVVTDATLAGHYLQYGYGGDYAHNITTACSRF